MSTQIEVMNSALTHIGAQRVNSIDESSEGARLASANYDRARRYVLRQHPWNSATSRVALSKLTSSPAFGYDNAFALPSDNLRVISTNLYNDQSYRIEGAKLLTNASSVSIVYIRDETNLNTLDDLLVDLISMRLGILIGRRVTGDVAVVQELRAEWPRAFTEAKSVDASEDAPDYLWGDVWSAGRFGHNNTDDILRYGTYFVP